MNFEFREKSLSSGNCCDNVKIQKDRDNKVNAGYIPAPPAFADFTQKGEAAIKTVSIFLNSEQQKGVIDTWLFGTISFFKQISPNPGNIMFVIFSPWLISYSSFRVHKSWPLYFGFCELMCCLDSDGSKVENPPLCHLIAVFWVHALICLALTVLVGLMMAAL